MNNKLSGFSSKSVLSSRSLLKDNIMRYLSPQENLSEYLNNVVLNIAEHGNYSSELIMFDPFIKPIWLGENAKPRGIGSHEVSSTIFLVFPRNKVKLTGSDSLYKLKPPFSYSCIHF